MIAMLEVDNVSTCSTIPPEDHFQQWIDSAIAALNPSNKRRHIAIRIVDEPESAQLNKEYRGNDKPTNVLSFPSNLPAELLAQLPEHPMGDLVICAAVVEKEAQTQQKELESHWAHMVIHGTLHLAGYDHQVDVEAEIMESLEIQILSTLNIEDPYQIK
jgi:probable rRNA maturation factor